MISRFPHFDLSTRNTFRMKVRCALYVEVTEESDLATLDWDALPQPVFVMGGGSNLLFSGDFPGTVLHVGMRFSRPSGPRNDNVIPTPSVIPSEASVSHITVGAGVVFDDFCAWAASEGLWGPENLSLIPGEVGASAVQNIGAYGVEAKDLITGIRAWDREERRFVDIDPADCAYGYRASRFKTEWKGRFVITAVTYRLSADPKPVLDYGGVRKALEARGTNLSSETCSHPRLHKREGPVSEADGRGRSEAKAGSEDRFVPLTPQLIRDTIIGIRRTKLPDPAETGSAGSFFCNPVISREHFAQIVETARKDNGPDYAVPHYEVGDKIKVPAAWMIEQCGFKGAVNGGAQVYPKQPLVIVNASGSATPAEVIGLRDRVIDTVQERYGVTLHPEVELV